MSIELWALLGTSGLLYLSIFLQTNHSSLSLGLSYSLSNRDVPMSSTPLGGRLSRATANSLEGLAVFAPLVIIGQLAQISNQWTQYAALAYLLSRALYLPCYALGLSPHRTVVWSLGFFALPFFIFGLFA